MLMGGCDQNTATSAAKRINAPSAFKLVPIFLSSGTTDTMADPEMTHWVERSMKSNGFRHVRFESYQGVHDVYPQHTAEALQWFTAAASSGGATPDAQIQLRQFFQETVDSLGKDGRNLRRSRPKTILAP